MGPLSAFRVLVARYALASAACLQQTLNPPSRLRTVPRCTRPRLPQKPPVSLLSPVRATEPPSHRGYAARHASACALSHAQALSSAHKPNCRYAYSVGGHAASAGHAGGVQSAITGTEILDIVVAGRFCRRNQGTAGYPGTELSRSVSMTAQRFTQRIPGTRTRSIDADGTSRECTCCRRDSSPAQLGKQSALPSKVWHQIRS